MNRSRSPFVTALLIFLVLFGGFALFNTVTLGLPLQGGSVAFQVGQVVGAMFFPAIGAVALWKLVAPRSALDAEHPQLGSQVVGSEIGDGAIELPRHER